MSLSSPGVKLGVLTEYIGKNKQYFPDEFSQKLQEVIETLSKRTYSYFICPIFPFQATTPLYINGKDNKSLSPYYNIKFTRISASAYFNKAGVTTKPLIITLYKDLEASYNKILEAIFYGSGLGANPGWDKITSNSIINSGKELVETNHSWFVKIYCSDNTLEFRDLTITLDYCKYDMG